MTFPSVVKDLLMLAPSCVEKTAGTLGSFRSLLLQCDPLGPEPRGVDYQPSDFGGHGRLWQEAGQSPTWPGS